MVAQRAGRQLRWPVQQPRVPCGPCCGGKQRPVLQVGPRAASARHRDAAAVFACAEHAEMELRRPVRYAKPQSR